MPYVSDRANYPALARAAFMVRLPTAIRARLSACAPLAESAIETLRSTVFPIDDSGIGGAVGQQPEGYWFKLAGRRSSALAHLETSMLHVEAGTAKLIATVGFTEPESTTPKAWRAAVTGYAVDWKWAIDTLPVMYPSLGNAVALVSDDWRYGVAISTYVGYLAWELDDHETVYEVARWRPEMPR